MAAKTIIKNIKKARHPENNTTKLAGDPSHGEILIADDVVAVESPAFTRNPINLSSEKILNDERSYRALSPSGIFGSPAVLKTRRASLLAPKTVGKSVIQSQRRSEPRGRARQRLY